MRSFSGNKNIDIYLNDKLIKTLLIPENDTNITLLLGLKHDKNYLLFESKENCTIMGNILKNDDDRCVTIGIKNFDIIK